ncbi:P-loop containing nucleoside triphosphate hydrolase protein [Hyaloraphidium curvatum]|nr:P-loop containing nucleoside triphosphate hydrolase protein [Hyaloraphidium curvatum]
MAASSGDVPPAALPVVAPGHAADAPAAAEEASLASTAAQDQPVATATAPGPVVEPARAATGGGVDTVAVQATATDVDAVNPELLKAAAEEDAPVVQKTIWEEVKDYLKPSGRQAELSKAAKVSFASLFRYSDSWDRFLMFVGIIAAMAAGGSQIYVALGIGDVTQPLIQYSPICDDPEEYAAWQAANPGFPLPPIDQCNLAYLNAGMLRGVIQFAILGAISFTANFIYNLCWQRAGERQSKRIREMYLEALLRQEIAWHDGKDAGELVTRISGDVNLIQEGISEKVAAIVSYVTVFIGGIVIAFVRGWQMALVVIAVFPLLAGAGAMMGILLSKGTTGGQESYSRAGSVAQEALQSVRTVQAFGREETESSKYEAELDQAERKGKINGFIQGIGLGTLFCILFCIEGLAFWYGSTLIESGTYDAAQVLSVFFALLFGSFTVANIAPNLSALGVAQGAAFEIFNTIERHSEIDALSSAGLSAANLRGDFELRNVDFFYPTRPEYQVLKNFSLTIRAGTMVALVGGSGSGKSTVIKLLNRFYDPQVGEVQVDGRNIKDYNVRSLRSKIGIVSQEPVLFDMTIRSNIEMGLESTSAFSKEELHKMVVEAAEIANAREFIEALPEGYDTHVGSGMLSGGQKQRVAIARAIISNPSVLLLDEATSALDTTAERIVQAALDNASKSRTTIVVAHRLSTIKNSDVIVVMEQGQIIESGNHEELVAKGGVYAGMVQAQALRNRPLDGGAPGTEAVVDMNGANDVEMEKLKIKRSRTAQSAAEMRRLQEEEKERKQKEKEERMKKQPAPWGRLARLNAPEWKWLVLGAIGAIINGAIQPVFALVFANITSVFAPFNPNLRSEANFWSGMFAVLGVIQLIAWVLQVGFFTMSGEAMTRRVRADYFRTLLRSDIGFLDDPANSSGILTARLATEATEVKGLTGQLLGSILQVVVSLVAGIAIAFANSWQVALVVLACVPVLVAASAIDMSIQAGNTGVAKELYVNSNAIATEAVSEIRTVSGLAKNQYFQETYKAALVKPHERILKGTWSKSFAAGFSQGGFFLVWCLAYYASGRFVGNGTNTALQVQTAIFAIIFAALAVGQASTFAPNIVKAKLAALSIFETMDRTPRVDAASASGKAVDQVEGNFKFQGVTFNYPTRPEAQVLKGVDLEGFKGQTVALVGPSGSGKSTIIQLLERFYDIMGGSASLESLEIRNWNVRRLRESMALVQQEPALLGGSIQDNIAYGKPPTQAPATMAEIEAAARMANAHDFIMGLPQGYKTKVGAKGGLLSGGQKQRVAIARALIRNPRLLLLDEATAALDAKSERVVQDALDKARTGRTTITIAHRLSTIQDADAIWVFKLGRVIEHGKHDELLALNGQYAELVTQQSLASKAVEEDAKDK